MRSVLCSVHDSDHGNGNYLYIDQHYDRVTSPCRAAHDRTNPLVSRNHHRVLACRCVCCREPCNGLYVRFSDPYIMIMLFVQDVQNSEKTKYYKLIWRKRETLSLWEFSYRSKELYMTVDFSRDLSNLLTTFITTWLK